MGLRSAAVGVIKEPWVGETGENLLVEIWSNGFGASDCRRESRIGDCGGDESEMDRCDAVSFSLSENEECAEPSSSSSESGRAVGGGITKWEFSGVGSGESAGASS